MSNSTFLITNYGTFSIRNTRIGLIILGFSILALYISAYLSSGEPTLVNPYMVFMATSFIITGTIGLSKKSRFSPKIKIEENALTIKEGLWSGISRFNWDDIKQIKLGSYKIWVTSNGKEKKFNLDSTSQISIEIKKAIREIGLQKNITVIGG